MIEIIPNYHPIFVHFTVALLTLSVALFAISSLLPDNLKQQWQIVARWSLWFGAAITLITAITGLHAYSTVAHDGPSHLAMTDHRNWAAATVVLFIALAGWLAMIVKKSAQPNPVFIVAMLIAGGVLASTAWHGGELVYRHGLGVMSLPDASGEGHHHEHADGHDHDHGSPMPAENVTTVVTEDDNHHHDAEVQKNLHDDHEYTHDHEDHAH